MFFPPFKRLKDFTFEHQSFTMELPKSMLLADVAVRVMYPMYDLLTPCGRSYHHKKGISSSKCSRAAPEEVREIASNRKGSARSQEEVQVGEERDRANGNLGEEQVGHCG